MFIMMKIKSKRVLGLDCSNYRVNLVYFLNSGLIFEFSDQYES
jgi:hypothetical protein